MSNNVILMAEFSIKSGELDNFTALVNEMVEATQANEPDTIIYEIFISEDGKSCQIMERYVDSAAAMTHVGNFGRSLVIDLGHFWSRKGSRFVPIRAMN